MRIRTKAQISNQGVINLDMVVGLQYEIQTKFSVLDLTSHATIEQTQITLTSKRRG